MNMFERDDETFTFEIPIRKFTDHYETVTLDWDSLCENARHGVDQRMNDCHSGVKRVDYASGDIGTKDWIADVLKKVHKVRDRLNAGLFTTARRRGPADPRLAKARKLVHTGFADATDEELAIAMAAINAARATAPVETPPAE